MADLLFFTIVVKLYQRITEKIRAESRWRMTGRKILFLLEADEFLGSFTSNVWHFITFRLSFIFEKSRQFFKSFSSYYTLRYRLRYFHHGLHVYSHRPWSRIMSAREYRFWHFLVTGNSYVVAFQVLVPFNFHFFCWLRISSEAKCTSFKSTVLSIRLVRTSWRLAMKQLKLLWYVENISRLWSGIVNSFTW